MLERNINTVYQRLVRMTDLIVSSHSICKGPVFHRKLYVSRPPIVGKLLVRNAI